MSDITEIINTIEKSWGVNSIGCPLVHAQRNLRTKK